MLPNTTPLQNYFAASHHATPCDQAFDKPATSAYYWAPLEINGGRGHINLGNRHQCHSRMQDCSCTHA